MTLIIALCSAAALLAIAGLSVLTARIAAATALINGLCTAAALISLAVALKHLLSAAPPETLTLPLGIPWLGAHFRIDTLSAFFLVVIDLGAATASIFAIGYGRHEEAPARVLPFYPAFLAAMNLVVMADDAFSFLLSWEFMSLSSWALVVSHHRVAENVRAGYVYLVMASFGTLALLLAFGLLAGPEGHYAFAQIRAAHPTAGLAALVLLLALVGAGSKAGLVPLHVWLPLAHPAAPSQVSALMSGVMTKVAVYAFIRIIFDLVGTPAWWWSVVVLALGGATAVMGVLYALMQHDLKRLLAYHTVENIGIIFIGLGLALAFKANGMAIAAALALTAGLLHVFNHSLFKSLLFFGSGAVLNATGERDMEHLGGLIHRMPQTAFVFLVGCTAISALPPLNGFVSEWLTFQAILLSPQLPSWGLKLLVPAVGALLALSATLAAACFVKAFGVTFLGRPRSRAAQSAKETDRFSLAAMYFLGALCLVIGIVPGPFIDALAPLAQALVGGRMPLQTGEQWLSIVPIAASRSSYDGLLVFLFMVISGTLAAATIHRFASDRLRRGPAWDCGYPDASPSTQYSASSFAQPIRRVFGTVVFRARERVEMPPPGDMRPARLAVDLRDPLWDEI
jgi:formate hydrogenlyase subunit 3/multisubunit Na+/H+ antiporter MnhD subunit